MDETKCVWEAQDGSYLISEKKSHQIYYMYDGNIGILYKLNNKEQPQWELERAKPEFEPLRKFEDPAFTEIWHDKERSQVIILLPRYNLEFYSKAPLQFTAKGFENYQLAFDESIPIKNFEHALVLKPIDSRLNLNRLYLIPKQQFLPSKEKENDSYFKLSLYLKNKKICWYLIKNTWKLYGKIKFSDVEAITSEKNNYTKQEQFAIYTKNNQGALTSQNISDELYLAYIYFAQRDPQLCYQKLEELIHRISWNEEEFTYLINIITETPCQIIDKAQAELCTSTGPEYLSTRLFALYFN